MDPWLAQTIFPFGFILRIGGMINQKENKVRIKSTLIQLFNDQSPILSLFKWGGGLVQSLIKLCG